MSEPAPSPGPAPPAAARRRFGWPMRLFLAVLLFDMAYRSLTVALPWKEWNRELALDPMPERLPTRAQMADLSAQSTPEKPHLLRDRILDSFDSVWTFFKPWPDPPTRARLRSGADWGKYTLCWLNSRLEFVENVAGINEEWPMFSPNVSRRQRVARARLIYADGSQRVQRNHGDPEDLTRYSHWFEEKVLDHELKVRDGEGYKDEAKGYCNLLAHRYRLNAKGHPLRKIRLFMVRYRLPPPDVDARAFLAAQNDGAIPADRVGPDFYEYDVATRDGTWLLND
jgi:hypothetical protein